VSNLVRAEAVEVGDNGERTDRSVGTAAQHHSEAAGNFSNFSCGTLVRSDSHASASFSGAVGSNRFSMRMYLF
jgi:hypothetical protein